MANVDTEEKLSNLGYCALEVEATKGTAVQPSIFVPLYSESVVTNLNLDEDKPMRGIRDEIYDHIKGIKDHQGEIEILAEPITAAHFFNMLLKKDDADGSDPYTHAYSLDVSSTQPKSYTLELLKGDIPFRYFGVEAKSIKPTFSDNVMHLNVSLVARGQFSVARIKSASGTALELTTEHSDDPTDGLTTDDTLILYDTSEGTYEEVTITSITDGENVVVSTDISGTYEEGDICYLKQLSPSYSLLAPFTWGQTEFCFGADAATALSATHTPLEKGSEFEVIHSIHDDVGSKRSGSFDPTKIIRTTGRVNATIKKAFTDGQKYHKFLHRLKEALVIRCYSKQTCGTSDADASEIRITINNPRVVENPTPLEAGGLIFMEQSLVSQYDSDDSQGFSVTVINDQDDTDL